MDTQPGMPAPTPPTPPPAAQTPTPPAGAPPSLSTPHKSNAPLVMGGVVVGGLAVLGLISYAAMSGLLPFLSPKAPPTLEELVENMERVESARIELAFSGEITDREEGVTPIPVDNDGDVEMPGEGRLDFTVITDWQKNDETADGTGQLKGEFESSGFSMKFDMEVLQADKTMYLKINKLPFPIFFDTSEIEDKWISFPNFNAKSDPEGWFEDQFASASIYQKVQSVETSDESERKFKQFQQESEALNDAFMKSGAFQVDSVEEIKFNDAAAWEYEVSIDAAKLRDALMQTVEDREELVPGVEEGEYLLLEPKEFEWLKEEKAFVRFEAAMKNLSTTLTVPKKSRLVERADFRIALAPESEESKKIADKQITIEAGYEMTNINKPVQVDAPSDDDVMTIKEAVMIMSGMTEAENRFTDQTSVISELQDALETYQTNNGTYPASLDLLIGQEEESYFTYEGMEVRVVTEIPNDIYTNAPYPYTATADTYRLEYQLEFSDDLPEYLTGGYVDGTNTATESDESLEGVSPWESYDDGDTDDDGLTDDEEWILGTSPYFADTDGDGFSDGDEVAGGYDPLVGSGS